MKIGQNNPETFWSIINRINNCGKKQIDPEDNTPEKKWVSHFKALLNGKNVPRINHILHTEVNTFNLILDSRISDKEVQESLGELKVGKSCGLEESWIKALC